MSGIFLSFLLLRPLAAIGSVVYFGMGGCLDSVVLMTKGGCEVADAGVDLSAAAIAFRGVAEEYEMVRLERCRAFFCLSLVFCKLSSVLNSGVPFLHCRRTGRVI